ncbi:MAG: hypothetical protein AAB019_08125, partial [Planctomycetota bacterium]
PEVNSPSVISDGGVKKESSFQSRLDGSIGSEVIGSGSMDEIKKLWPAVLARLKDQSQKVYALVREGRFMKADEEELVVGFSKKHSFHRNLLQDLKYRQVIEECIEKVSGRKLSFATTEIPDEPEGTVFSELAVESIASGPPEADKQLNINNSREQVNQQVNPALKRDKLNETLKDSAVKKILSEFGGLIVNIEE